MKYRNKTRRPGDFKILGKCQKVADGHTDKKTDEREKLLKTIQSRLRI